MSASEAMEPTPGKCNARTRPGGLCRRPAGHGTEHRGVGSCSLHAGSTPSGVRAAARQTTEAEARAMLTKLGDATPLTNPVGRLQQLAGEVDQWLSVCRRLVEALAGDFTSDTLMQGEQIRARVVLYTDAIDRLHKIGADLVRLNLEERAQRLDEVQSRLVWDAVDRGLRGSLPGELYQPVRHAIGRAAQEMLDELEPTGMGAA